jgi:RNA-directed DNA polymerase
VHFALTVANVYLNYLDTIWENKFTELGTLVRYADDLVILCKTKEQALKAIDVLKAVFCKLELQMNTSKSKLINLWDDKEGFDSEDSGMEKLLCHGFLC